ncbi:penicillin-binding protein 2 [Deferribacterales bacterium RsTz2092]|nr:stage V sporulation protein D [Deferribacterales bacterium]
MSFRLFGILALLFMLTIGVRLLYLQVVRHSFYAALVTMQSSTKEVFSTDRGVIYDSNGSPLVSNRKVASLYTFGRNIDEPDALFAALKANGITLSERTQNLIREKGGFVWLVRHIEVSQAEALKRAIPNIGYRLEDSRFYPEGGAMSGILGITGVDNQGLEGLEYYANKLLMGHAVPVSAKMDSRGKLILYDDVVINTMPDSAIYLTVDIQLQAIADRILRRDLAQFSARRAIAVAMETDTGNIVFAAYAASDKQENDLIAHKNYVTSYLFEPGSIYKAVTFAHLIESGLYNANSRLDVSRGVELHGHTIKDVVPHGMLTHKEVFTKSSNIGTVNLARRSNRDSFYKFMKKSGFGSKIGVAGMAEESGILRAPIKWSGLSQASISIGQELYVTPLQMLRYYAAIANGGIAPRPTIIGHYNISGNDYVFERNDERIMKETTANTLLDMLIATVQNGTGRKARSTAVSIGGKTGTGQIFNKKTGSYSQSDYTATFAGVFPADKPKFAMLVIYEAPKASIFGGDTGTMTFKSLAEQVTFFYNAGGVRGGIYASK